MCRINSTCKLTKYFCIYGIFTQYFSECRRNGAVLRTGNGRGRGWHRAQRKWTKATARAGSGCGTNSPITPLDKSRAILQGRFPRRREEPFPQGRTDRSGRWKSLFHTVEKVFSQHYRNLLVFSCLRNDTPAGTLCLHRKNGEKVWKLSFFAFIFLLFSRFWTNFVAPSAPNPFGARAMATSDTNSTSNNGKQENIGIVPVPVGGGSGTGAAKRRRHIP